MPAADPRLAAVVGEAMNAAFAAVSPTGTDQISVHERIAQAVDAWYQGEYPVVGYKVLVDSGEGFRDAWEVLILHDADAAIASARKALKELWVQDSMVVSLREVPFPPTEED